MQETLYDELASKLGIDRLEFRLKNALRNGYETATGQRLDESVGIAPMSRGAVAALEASAADAESVNTGRPLMRRGVGVASCWYGCGNTSLPNPSTIRIGVSPDGAVVLHQGAVDIGQGSNTVIAQIAADALGLPLAAFQLVGADTALTPDAGKTSASRQTFVTGKAARRRRRRCASRSCAPPMFPSGEIRFEGALVISEGDAVRAWGLTNLPRDDHRLCLLG